MNIPPYTTIDLITPAEGNRVYLCRYWVCRNSSVDQGIIYNGIHLCHTEKNIAIEMLEEMRQKFPGDFFGICFLKFSFV